MKQHQVLARLKGVAANSHSVITRVHHELMKNQLLAGIVKTYEKKDDEGDDYPGEYQRVVMRADRKIAELLVPLAELLDVTAARDYTNTVAVAEVAVDGVTLIEKAPVPYLLWLEQRLLNYVTVLSKLPTLDPSTTWTWDPAEGAYASDPVRTVKTKKVEFPLILHPPTDKHPAQVKVSTTDEVQGYWTTRRLSGAFRQDDVDNALDRTRKLLDAVRIAHAEANQREAIWPNHGERVINYIFGPLADR